MSFLNIAKLAASAKAKFATREAHTPQENLRIINAAAKGMAEAIDAYKGGIFAAMPLANANGTLVQAIQDTITDAQIDSTSESGPAIGTETEAMEILEYLRTTLRPQMQASIRSTQEKKDLFAASNLQSVMLGKMSSLWKLTRQLGEALFENAPDKQKAEGRAVMKEVDDDFEKLIESLS